MSKKEVIDHFRRRARDYEKYSAWCNNPTLLDMCTEPLKDMLPSVKCLDVGGGTGRLAYDDFQRSGRNWTVLDACSGMGAQVRSCLVFVEGDAENMALPDNTFSHITIRSLLQYVNADKVLKECARVVTNRGHLVVAQKILRLPELEDNVWLREYWPLRNPLIRNQWSIGDQESAIRSAGWRVLTTRTYKERRVIPLNEWLSRSGTINKDRQRRLHDLITNAPEPVQAVIDFRVEGGILSYNRLWAVTVARLETVLTGLAPVVVSLIVERQINGERHILLQKRKKRYEESPSYFGSLELPQGKIEVGQDLASQMRRELSEETGLELDLHLPIESQLDQLSTLTVEQFKPFCCTHVSGDMDFVAFAIIVNASGEPRSIDINREHRWVNMSELGLLLSSDRFFPLNRPIIDQYWHQFRCGGSPDKE